MEKHAASSHFFLCFQEWCFVLFSALLHSVQGAAVSLEQMTLKQVRKRVCVLGWGNGELISLLWIGSVCWFYFNIGCCGHTLMYVLTCIRTHTGDVFTGNSVGSWSECVCMCKTNKSKVGSVTWLRISPKFESYCRRHNFVFLWRCLLPPRTAEAPWQ